MPSRFSPKWNSPAKSVEWGWGDRGKRAEGQIFLKVPSKAFISVQCYRDGQLLSVISWWNQAKQVIISIFRCVFWGITSDEYLFYVGSHLVNIPLIEMCFVGTSILLKDSNIEANEYPADWRKDFPRGLALNVILPTLAHKLYSFGRNFFLILFSNHFRYWTLLY